MQTLNFLPQNCKDPGITPTYQLAIAAVDLTDALHDISNNRVVYPFPRKIMEALKTLRDIFRTAVGEPCNDKPYDEPTTILNRTSARFKDSTLRESMYRYPTRHAV